MSAFREETNRCRKLCLSGIAIAIAVEYGDRLGNPINRPGRVRDIFADPLAKIIIFYQYMFIVHTFISFATPTFT